MIRLPEGFSWDLSLKLGRETGALTARTWPNFLVDSSDIPDDEFTFELSREELARRFPSWGIRHLESGKLAAFASGVLTSLDVCGPVLPAAGWRAAIESCATGADPSSFCLLAANVDPEWRGAGLAAPLIEMGKHLAAEQGFRTVIGPVRPSRKHEYPQLSMDEYLRLRDERGEIFDPWLRAHVRLGAEVLNVCPDSVVIRATAERWRQWTGQALEHSGEYHFPHCLAPTRIDLERGEGVYREPNVWVRYRL